MQIYDISMKIASEMPVYKNKDEKRPSLQTVQDFSTGSAYESRLTMDMHTGTHIDAPLHMIQNGRTIESVELASVVTRCRVLDMTSLTWQITKDDLMAKEVQEGEFILLKTRNSYQAEFDFEFVFLEATGAEYLWQKKVIGVGIDALGIERNQPNHETHQILLGNGITILEGLRLKDISEGEYFLCAAPLNISGAEAAPVRALLIKNDEMVSA